MTEAQRPPTERDISRTGPVPPSDLSLARALFGVAGTRVLLLVLGASLSVVLSRSLGPVGRGEYATVVAMAATAIGLAHLSIEQVQVYLVSAGRSVNTLCSNALVLGLGLGVVAAVSTLAVAALTHYPVSDSLHYTPLLLAVSAIPPSLVVLYSNGLLVLDGRIKQLNGAALLAGVVQLLVLGLLALIHRLTVTTVLITWVINAVLPLLVSIPALRPRRVALSRRLMWNEVLIGLRYHPGSASLYLLLRVDVLILVALAGARAVGLYTLAVSLVELTNVATDSVATVVLRRQSLKSLDDSATFTARVVGISLVFACVGAGGLAAVGWVLIPYVFGPAFSASVPALFSLIPGVAALAITRPIGGYLLRLNRPWVVTSINIGAMISNVLLNLFLIPRLGIVGAGLASSIAYMLAAASFLAWFVMATGVPWGGFKPPSPHLLARRGKG